MRLEELTEQSHELLKAVLYGVEPSDEGEPPIEKFRQAFILYHAKSILQIAEDILDLEDRNRTASSPLLVRGMLENLFILGAASRNKEFIGQKIIYDLEMTAHYARSTAKRSSSNKLKEYLEDEAISCDANAKKLRQKHQIDGKFKLSPADCAEKADLLRLYAIEYAHYSAATHGEFFSLFFKEQIGQRLTPFAQ